MYKDIEFEEFNALSKDQNTVLIDVRSEGEYSQGIIPNALTGFDFNSGEFYDKIDELDTDKNYILICRSGNRSIQACMAMAANGFTNLYNLKGGMSNWKGEVIV